ncbi:PDDEXK nuclease domain-containing protein [Sphaerothrix gracilis]|uniref:PDDEXK nuclease domain-containing protein n=1 Tax=Sphaerothrix gracilis TaxID=3151835 RepID=UPI0031FDAA4A
MPRQPSLLPDEDNYFALLNGLKNRIRSAQIKAALAVNRELVLLYWHIGREILQRQREQGWGSKVIPRLAKDLKREFPDMKGFSRTNLLYMRAFADAWPDEKFVQELLGQITWYHNLGLLDKLNQREERLWYARETIANGWSRNVMVMQIESGLYRRQGGAITNFDRTLPPPQSDLAHQLVKDPYNFDFLTLGRDAQERELERGLVEHIRDFLLELGVGFAFIGNQYPIVVDDKEYRLDLLFYHARLHCYVVIDLKMGEFEPEFSGKMNFYVSAVDNYLRSAEDNRTIGIILCRSKRKTTVEFALQDVQKPIGVSTYRLQHDLPEALQKSLPTPEQLEMELESAIQEIEAKATEPGTNSQ